MTQPPNRRFVLQSTLAASAAWALPRAQACEYFTPTLRVNHPWTRATPASAGYALLGMRFDEVTEDEELLDVQTPVAQAVVFIPALITSGHIGKHAPAALAATEPEASATGLRVHIPAGRETVLGQTAPGHSGAHLRLLRLTQDLEIGRSYPLRLVFKQGGTVKALLNVDFARFT